VKESNAACAGGASPATLLDAHRAQLHASGLNDKAIAAAGIYSVTDAAAAARLLKWDGRNGPAPAIAFPVTDFNAVVVQTVLRPDAPRSREDGSVAKYEQPFGEHHRVWYPPHALIPHERLLDSTQPLFFTEGIKKALAVCQAGTSALSMQGVSVWHDTEHRDGHRGEPDEWRLHPDLASLPLRGRRVFIGFDGGDTTNNVAVIYGETRLARMLLEAGADVRLLRIPFSPGGSKVGLDDHLAQAKDQKNALQELMAKAPSPDPFLRAKAIRELPRKDRAERAAALLADFSFAAAVHVGGQATFDVVKAELYQAAGMRKAALREAVDRFRAAQGAKMAGTSAVQDAEASPYEMTPAGIVWHRETRDGLVDKRLSNFTARITSDVTEDDGVETSRAFQLEATLNGRTTSFRVPSGRFHGLDWAVEHLGVGAVIFPGFGGREHLPVAIQLLSEKVVSHTVYTQIGWRKLDGKWCYLHAGGAIGTVGTVPDVEVELSGQLRTYRFPALAGDGELKSAVRASLGALGVAPDAVIFPLYCTVWRAPLGAADFGLHLSGQTGAFKSELAALVQRHFGVEMDARHLPGSWTSTGNALEAAASAAADAVFVVDDFCPTGSTNDVHRLNAAADRLFRGAGNGSGRQRMGADLKLRPLRPPRCLIVSTGEDIPAGHSLRARLLCIEVGPNVVKVAQLARCQADAGSGLYASATAGFVRWLAGRRDELLKRMRSEVPQLRDMAQSSASHRRTPETVAHLYFAFSTFIAFAREVGAVESAESEQLLKRCWTALGVAAAQQASLHAEAEPTHRFLELLSSALVTGRGHLANTDGAQPENGSALGWRDGKPLGDRIGWTDGKDLYLDLNAAAGVTKKLGESTGAPLLLSGPTLAKRLKDKGLLLSTDEKRQRLTIRRVLEGSRRVVLHLALEAVRTFGEPSQPSHPGDSSGDGPAEPPPRDGSGPVPEARRPTENASEDRSSAEPGTVGTADNSEGAVPKNNNTPMGRSAAESGPKPSQSPAHAGHRRARV
jgi:hypothetical protein